MNENDAARGYGFLDPTPVESEVSRQTVREQMRAARKRHVMVCEDESDPLCWLCNKGAADDIHFSAKEADAAGIAYDVPRKGEVSS